MHVYDFKCKKKLLGFLRFIVPGKPYKGWWLGEQTMDWCLWLINESKSTALVIIQHFETFTSTQSTQLTGYSTVDSPDSGIIINVVVNSFIF